MDKQFKPHKPILVEATWNRFIPLVGGELISEIISKTPNFENADYLFKNPNIIIELKEVETDFINQKGINEKITLLRSRLHKEEPTWRPRLFGGDGNYPAWFNKELWSILRKPVVRIVEKANR